MKLQLRGETDMAKKEESEFRVWFVAQHGQRPSGMPAYDLRDEFLRANDRTNIRREMLEKCIEYDARETSALYAWQAARKNKCEFVESAISDKDLLKLAEEWGITAIPGHAYESNLLGFARSVMCQARKKIPGDHVVTIQFGDKPVGE